MNGVQKIDRMIEKLRRADEFIVLSLKKISDENRHAIEDKNIEQLRAGLDGDGNEIEPAYTPFTVSMKQAKGQVYDHVTLEDEGQFHRGITANILNGGIEMEGKDKKTPMLQEKYGSAIIKLNKKSVAELRVDLYKPELRKDFKTYITT
jgi:hypothetical protein